jgi:curli production assembly/transport component CsgG
MRGILLATALISLGGCAATRQPMSAMVGKPHDAATLQQQTSTQRSLMKLPGPQRPIPVAVYSFSDQTGQFRPTESGQTLSRAVSQGGTAILMKALQDAGRRSWFTVVERENLSSLLNERQIIREMRERYLGETKVNPEALPSLLFAGVILGGGVIGYDSSTITGGAGAGFLGISARTEYRQDTVTVALRAISVRTGEVLASVTTSKTIASYSVGGGAFRYVGFKQLLEAETGVTTNEPDQLALQQAIEKAVFALIMEGSEQQLWSFADQKLGDPIVAAYRDERDGKLTPEQVEKTLGLLMKEAQASPVKVSNRARARLDAAAAQVAVVAPRQTATATPNTNSARTYVAAGAPLPAAGSGN